MVQYSIVQHSILQYSMVQYSMVWCCIVQYSIVWYAIVQYIIVYYSIVYYPGRSTRSCRRLQVCAAKCKVCPRRRFEQMSSSRNRVWTKPIPVAEQGIFLFISTPSRILHSKFGSCDQTSRPKLCSKVKDSQVKGPSDEATLQHMYVFMYIYIYIYTCMYVCMYVDAF